jgi:glycosyltransferase involved in cell wall biosynthesis
MEPFHGNLRLIPNGLDTAAYVARARTNLRPSLVWLRSFHGIYEPELAPRVLAKISTRFFGARLLMVGSDRGDGSLERTVSVARELGVVDRIEFPGGVPKQEVAGWLDRGDIFINTTTVDNAPVSVLEALASGMCIVSTNVGGIPYVLQDGYNALLVPPGSPGEMADAVLRLLSQPELAAELSRNALETAKRFDWSKVLPDWEHLFEEITGDARP